MLHRDTEGEMSQAGTHNDGKSEQEQIPVLFIVGATGVGKTKLSIEIAKGE